MEQPQSIMGMQWIWSMSHHFFLYYFPFPFRVTIFHRNALQRNRHSTGHFCSIQKQFYSSEMVLTSYLFHQRIEIPQEDFYLTQGVLVVEIACNVLSLDTTICKWIYYLQCWLPWIFCSVCVYFIYINGMGLRQGKCSYRWVLMEDDSLCIKSKLLSMCFNNIF